MVQPMVAGNAELLAGLVQDPVFGPLVAFGPGGALNADDPQTSAFWLGASNGTIILTIIGFVLFLIVMVAWVKTEDTKLMNQAMRLRGSETPPTPEMQ